MDDPRADRAQAPLRAGVYGRLSETYDAGGDLDLSTAEGAY
jgi:hypothetical protein